jgi:hypothetical protein
MLKSSQILRALKQHPWTRDYVLGVFPCNRLPTNPPLPSCLVVNSDPEGEPGSHWLAIYLSGDGVIDYFDSYGLEPSVPAIVSWIRANSTGVNCNRVTVQSLMSATCGQHCIYFLLFRCRGLPMYRITNCNTSSFVNDAYVCAYVNKHCNMQSVVFDENVLVEQLCTVFGIVR